MSEGVAAERAGELEGALRGRVVLLAPHMDDELIGCGAILASLPRPERLFVVYATDGAGSPSPPLPWIGVDREALARTRRDEARAGLEALGITGGNAHFLGLPDGRLGRNPKALRKAVAGSLETLAPDTLLLPFRFDGHPDHLALHAAGHAVSGGDGDPRVLEYFVYARWRLLAERDVRRLLRPECLLRLEPDGEARARKRRALECHRTQTTRWFDWQARPNLTAAFIERACGEPELLLDRSRCDDGGLRGAAALRLRLVHALEPRLKRGKDRVLASTRALVR